MKIKFNNEWESIRVYTATKQKTIKRWSKLKLFKKNK